MHFGPWLPWISEMRTTETQRKTKKKTGPQKTDGALELKRSKWGQNPSFHLAQERLPKYRFSSQVPDNLHYFGVILRFHRYIYIYTLSQVPQWLSTLFVGAFGSSVPNQKKTPRGRCGRRHGRVVQQEFVGGGIVKWAIQPGMEDYSFCVSDWCWTRWLNDSTRPACHLFAVDLHSWFIMVSWCFHFDMEYFGMVHMFKRCFVWLISALPWASEKAHMFEGLTDEQKELVAADLSEMDAKLPGGGLRLGYCCQPPPYLFIMAPYNYAPVGSGSPST